MTLIEILLGITVAGFVLIGAYSIYQVAYDNSQTEEVRKDVKNLVRRIDSLYRARENYSGVNNAQIESAGIARLFRNSSLTLPWGGNYVITPSAALGDSHFDITINGVPESACIDLAVRLYADDVQTQQISVNGVVFDDATPATPEEAGIACGGGDTLIVTAR